VRRRRQTTSANSQPTKRTKAVTATTPDRATSEQPAPDQAAPDQAAPDQATETPKELTQQPPAETPPPRAKAPRAKKATRSKMTPAEAPPARPPAKRAKPAPAKTVQAEADPTPAQAISDATPPAKAANEPTTGDETPTDEPTPIFTTLSAETAETGETTEATPATEARTEAWAQLIADPGHAPELLALAAVQTIGPRAEEWARRTRESYPTATDAGLARLATRQFTRFGGMSSVLGAAAGSYAPLALLGCAALTHAELILHLAAAYGLDPTDEERATDLLVLTRVHPTRDDAEAALRAAKQPAYEETARLTDAAWRLGRMVAAQTGNWAAIRLVNRFFPGTSLLAAMLGSRAATDTVVIRANAYFSQSNHEAGSRV
jgi:hypothetical protein